MPTYLFQKLVRDGLPQVYEQLNQKAELCTLDKMDHWRELKRKFAEESAELPDNLDDKATITNELGDLLRIVKDAAAVAGISFTDIEKADEMKTAKRGGFLGGIYVETLEIADDDPWNDYYRSEPDRFPEIKTHKSSVNSLITLSDTLAELGTIDRMTLLPGGRHETDSHHSFSLALVAYDICKKYCPELDADLVVRYALVHDLLEIITGDEDTLSLNHQQLLAKHERELTAMKALKRRLQNYPALLSALNAYEQLDTPEAATVYVLDKACTIWTHFWDSGASLHERGMHTRGDIDTWYQTQQKKLHIRLKAQPPQVILDIFEDSYQKMRKDLFDE